MRITLKDVAKLAGVNFTLVSKYLNASSQARMRPETRMRIEQAIRTLGYRPSAPARALRSGRSRIIGMVSGDLTNAFWAHFASCAMRFLRERGYQLLLAVRDSDATPEPLEFLCDRGVDGIIVSGADLPQDYNIPCPFVVHDTMSADRGYVVNPDIGPALAQALAQVRGRITALLPKNSVWNEFFPNAAARYGLDARISTVSLDPNVRFGELLELCGGSPEWLLVSGWHTLTQLQDILRHGYSAERPKLIVYANCRGMFMGAPEIACAVSSSATRLVHEVCSLLLELVGNGMAEPGVRKIPCRCVMPGSDDFSALCTQYFQLS